MPRRTREEYNEYMRKYMAKRYKKRKSQILEQLGGKCIKCESIDNLEIDHKDPDKKRFTIARCWMHSEEKLREELKKCQLLCKRCHYKKTLEDQGLNSRFTHGTYASYRHNKCRCEKCREACREHNREYRKRKREAGFIRRNSKWILKTRESGQVE